MPADLRELAGCLDPYPTTVRRFASSDFLDDDFAARQRCRPLYCATAHAQPNILGLGDGDWRRLLALRGFDHRRKVFFPLRLLFGCVICRSDG